MDTCKHPNAETRIIDPNTRSLLCPDCGAESDKFDITETVEFEAKPRKMKPQGFERPAPSKSAKRKASKKTG